MKPDVMKDALKARRGQGLEITLLINGQPVDAGSVNPDMGKDMNAMPSAEGVDSESDHSDKEEQNELGMAPDAPRLDDNGPAAVNLPNPMSKEEGPSIADELAKSGLGRMGKKKAMK